jgi:hypothetical protein
MIGKTLYLPGFSHLLNGSRPQAQRLAKEATALDGLAALVGRFIPAELFEVEGGQRRRVFTPWVTFIAFLGQVLSRGSACRETVRRVQAWAAASQRSVPDENTSAYCQARSRLEISTLQAAHEELGQWFEKHHGERWCGRSVKLVDGTGFSMPDTAANRQRWPYAGCQKPGCGFPTGHLVGLFCLATGRLVRFAADTLRVREIPLAKQLVDWMQPGEVILADRGFCGWGFMALLRSKGIDVVMRLKQSRLATKQTRVEWKKPKWKRLRWDKSTWDQLPQKLAVRLVRLRIAIPGFRTQNVVLATTLLDEAAYPDEAIAALYRRRWAVELFFRDIKTILGLDILRCSSPELVEKEIWMQVFGYNLVRALMLEAAWTYSVPLDRLSFKGTVDTLRQWTPLLAPTIFASKRARAELLRIIAADQLPERPNRYEPRSKKRRPKNYPVLIQPRTQLRAAALADPKNAGQTH